MNNKIFYAMLMFGDEDISWSASGYSNKELAVIEKFLKELNERISGKTIDIIDVLDDYDED